MTIYLVDDDDTVREAIRTLLDCAGFSVADFASGADFLRYARPGAGDCLVLDVHMPGMSGLELLDQMQRDGAVITTILMTGRPEPAIERAARRAGASLLAKPFRSGELLRAIEQCLGAAAEPVAAGARPR